MVAGTNKEIASSKFYLADQHSVRRTLSFKQETPVYFKLVTISKDDFFFFWEVCRLLRNTKCRSNRSLQKFIIALCDVMQILGLSVQK